MDQFTAACRAIEQILQGGRVGQPLAARITLHVHGGGEALRAGLARGLAAACGWLDGQDWHLAALGSLVSGHVAALVKFSAGQMALVSVGTCSAGPGLLELLAVGNHGQAIWEPERNAPAGDLLDLSSANSDAGQKFLDAVEKSLRTGSAVSHAGEILASPAANKSAAPIRAAAPQRMHAPLAPPYGVLLVAGGLTHQEMYAAMFAADPRCRLVALADEADIPPRRQRHNHNLAQQLGIPVVDDLDQALARPDVQLVCICAEPERRARIIVRAARSGKPLYLDKPLCATAAEVDQITSALSDAGVLHQMFSMVHNGYATRVRELALSQTLGELRGIHCDLFFAKGKSGSAQLGQPRREIAQPRQFELPDSKREFHNVGVYPAVLLHWIFERPVRGVFAATGNYFFAEHQQNDMEDFGMALVEFEGGPVASIAAGRTGWCSHPLFGLSRTSLLGTATGCTVDANRPRAMLFSDAAAWQMPAVHAEDPMGFFGSTVKESGAVPKWQWALPPDGCPNDVTWFVDCVQAGRASDVPVEIAAAAMRLLLAAYESAATGCVV